MSRGIKVLLAVVAVLVLVVVALFVAVPLVVPTTAVTAKVASAVKQATGRDLAVKGGVSVSLFPQPGVSAKDVSLSNAPWAGPQPLASLAALDIRLKLRPLLSGKVVVDRVVLENPVINLATDKEGRGNWVFNPVRQPSAKPEGTPEGKKGGQGGVPALAVGDIGISHGRLVYTDGATGRGETLDDVNLAASLPGGAAPLAAKGSVRWHDRAVEFSLRADNAENLLQGNGSPVDLHLASDVITAGFGGTVSLGKAAAGDGDLGVDVPSTRNLLGWIGVNPASLPPNGLGPMSLKSHLVLNADHVALNDLQLSLDAIKGSGALALTGGGARPKLEGKLDVTRLDLNPYLPPRSSVAPQAPAAKQPAAPATPSGGSQWSDEPIDTAPLRAADAELTLSAGSAAYRQLEIGNTEAALRLDNGRFVGDLSQMALYQGQLSGRVEIDGSGPALAAKADVTLAGVQAAPLLEALAGLDFLSGSASGQTTLTSGGRSERDLVGALGGSGRLSFAGGAIKGVDLFSMVSNLGGAFTGGVPEKQTQFGQMSGSYTITNGIMKNDDLSVVSPVFRLSGTGTINFPEKTLDYRLVPQLVAAAPGQPTVKPGGGLSVPVLIRGPWNHLSYAPDLGAIAGKKLGGAAKLLDKMMRGQSGTAPGQPTPLPIPIPIPGLGR